VDPILVLIANVVSDNQGRFSNVEFGIEKSLVFTIGGGNRKLGGGQKASTEGTKLVISREKNSILNRHEIRNIEEYVDGDKSRR
jgi:hypothetical protein